jgi:hypothetical protein
MNGLMPVLLDSSSPDWATRILSIVAIVVSIISLLVSRGYSRRNILLSVQQSIFKTLSDLVIECNNIWKYESELGAGGVIERPYYGSISKIIISMEVINRAFELFEKNSKSVREDEDNYFYLFWKQLDPGLRGFLRDHAFNIAAKLNNRYYTDQVHDIHIRFEKYFEPKF